MRNSTDGRILTDGNNGRISNKDWSLLGNGNHSLNDVSACLFICSPSGFAEWDKTFDGGNVDVIVMKCRQIPSCRTTMLPSWLCCFQLALWWKDQHLLDSSELVGYSVGGVVVWARNRMPITQLHSDLFRNSPLSGHQLVWKEARLVKNGLK